MAYLNPYITGHIVKSPIYANRTGFDHCAGTYLLPSRSAFSMIQPPVVFW